MARSETALFVPFQDLTEPWYSDVVDALRRRCTLELYDRALPFEAQVAPAFAVVDQGGWGTREMLDAAAEAGVSLWQVLGTGLDHFELAYAVERGLTVANTPGKYSAVGLAEHALLLMLCFAKSIDTSRANARSGRFYAPLNDDLEGRTLVIVGFGASGRELARRAGACGMRLVTVDELPIDETTAAEYGLAFAGGPGDLDALLPTADYVSLHVPLTRGTRGLVDRRRIGLLKRDAVIVNVARGGLVDEGALADALRRGRLRGAGLDVFAHEPLDPAHPLLALENVVATPHVAGGTRGTSRRRGRAVAENLVRALEGREILDRIVGLEALTG
jgi:D-3-phosphoglycerate dehydrogenase / 2-oxoglutarate reductase